MQNCSEVNDTFLVYPLTSLIHPPVISDWTSVESNNLTLEIKNSSHIKKAVFVYNINKEFIRKFDGVVKAENDFNIKMKQSQNFRD